MALAVLDPPPCSAAAGVASAAPAAPFAQLVRARELRASGVADAMVMRCVRLEPDEAELACVGPNTPERLLPDAGLPEDCDWDETEERLD